MTIVVWSECGNAPLDVLKIPSLGAVSTQGEGVRAKTEIQSLDSEACREGTQASESRRWRFNSKANAVVVDQFAAETT